MTKTVADAALFLDLVAGPSPYDPNSLPAPPVGYREALQQETGRLRIGYSRDLGYAVVQQDVAAAVDAAVEKLAGAGHEVVELEGGPPNLGAFWGALGNFELAGQLHEQLKANEGDFTRAFARGLRGAWEMTPELWGDSARKRMALNNWCAEVFETVDLLVTPTVPYDPPPAGGPFPEETDGRRHPPAGVASFTIPFNLSGHPALTLRAGMSGLGLPIGVQLVAPRHRDDLALQVGATLEAALPPSCRLLMHDALEFGRWVLVGARGWTDPNDPIAAQYVPRSERESSRSSIRSSNAGSSRSSVAILSSTRRACSTSSL